MAPNSRSVPRPWTSQEWTRVGLRRGDVHDNDRALQGSDAVIELGLSPLPERSRSVDFGDFSPSFVVRLLWRSGVALYNFYLSQWFRIDDTLSNNSYSNHSDDNHNHNHNHNHNPASYNIHGLWT
eukprot:maker-scaffold569_size135262-snap-gene-0.17 protein:Tk03356 transcript:maker-scaffold569_size135262-snap-gene-0.17-mRNA-1 annotation:"prolyl 4-hydroxylase subunit alpha-2-like"